LKMEKIGYKRMRIIYKYYAYYTLFVFISWNLIHSLYINFI
jgi:hypothetical protein